MVLESVTLLTNDSADWQARKLRNSLLSIKIRFIDFNKSVFYLITQADLTARKKKNAREK